MLLLHNREKEREGGAAELRRLNQTFCLESVSRINQT